MTVSQRASQIYKLTKSSGGTWQEAMSQAYEDIARQEMEREESEARDNINSLVENIRNATTGGFYNGRILNNMVGDMIDALVDLNFDKGLVYPYASAWNKLQSIGLNEIESLVYSYTKKDNWDSSFRLQNGRISNAWFNAAQNIMDRLGLEPSMIVGYTEALSFFVG